MEEHPDAELIARLRRGDSTALDALVDVHSDAIWRYLRRHCGDEDKARDMFQSAWEKALGRLDILQAESFRAYLFRIAFHLVCDEARKSRIRERRWGHPVNVDENPEALISDRGNPRQEAVLREDKYRLDVAIGELPDNLREVLLLRIEAELPFREIAEVLGCPLGTALARMHQAIDRLRTIMVKVEDKT